MEIKIDSNTATISTSDLEAHIEIRYNVRLSQISQLDYNVFKIERGDGPSWVARVFDSSWPAQVVQEHADILAYLEQHGFPAERCTRSGSLSVTHDGQHVLITDFIEGRRPRKGEQLFPKLGDLLGRLHSMEISDARGVHRKGGAWHHICREGGPREEIKAALAMLEELKATIAVDDFEMYESLESKLKQMDSFEDLPNAFVHPDFVPSNVITSNTGDLMIIDWSGSGIGPRAASLGWLLWAAGHRSMAQVEAVARGYMKHVHLTNGELDRLAGAVIFRHLVLQCWECCTKRSKVEEVVGHLDQWDELAGQIASIVSKLFRENEGD